MHFQAIAEFSGRIADVKMSIRVLDNQHRHSTFQQYAGPCVTGVLKHNEGSDAAQEDAGPCGQAG